MKLNFMYNVYAYIIFYKWCYMQPILTLFNIAIIAQTYINKKAAKTMRPKCYKVLKFNYQSFVDIVFLLPSLGNAEIFSMYCFSFIPKFLQKMPVWSR